MHRLHAGQGNSSVVPDHPGTYVTRTILEVCMLWTIIVILVVLWLFGLIGNIGGGLIHLLLVVALIVLIVNLVSGRRV